MSYPTGHAIGLKAIDGSELLVHIGIDTVQLNGEGFHVHVKEGQHVKMNETLIDFDLDLIKSKGYDPTVMVIVTNAASQERELVFRAA